MEAPSSQTSDKDDDLLDGMDLEGVSEQEKAEIKRALMESMDYQKVNTSKYTQKKERPSSAIVRRIHCRGRHKSQDTDGSLSPDTERTANGVEVDEDAETQEPETEINFEQETLKTNQSDDDDKTQPLSNKADNDDDDNNVDLDFSKSTQAMTNDLSAYNCPTDLDEEDLNKSQATEDMDTSNNASVPSSQEDANSSVGSQGFSPRLQQMSYQDRLRHGRSTPDRITRGSSSPDGPGPSRSSPDRMTGSRSTPERPAPGSPGGQSQDKGSQGSGKARVIEVSERGKEKTKTSSKDGSKGSENSSSPRLVRHYRAVKTQAPPCTQPYYCVNELNPEQCAKAIYQLFETYRIKLREAQRKLHPKVTWGDPVKSGPHQEKTIDIKRRGQTSVYLEISDNEDDDDEDFETGSKRPARRVKKTSSDSEDEIKRRRNVKSKVEAGIMSMETQEYDFGNGKESLGRKDFHEEEGPVRRGLRKRKPSRVLVEETQDLDLPDVGGRNNVNFIVEETQGSDEEMIDYLGVTKDQLNRKQTFENPMQQAKLKGFTIPRKGRSEKVTQEKTNEQSSQDEDIGESVNNKNQNNVGNRGAETKVEAGTGRGRKRKIKKEPVTLVEDTQDLEAEMSVKDKGKGGGKRKRQCFRLESSSSEEEMSVPETQRLVDSPELMIIEEKSSPVPSKAGRPKGIVTATSATAEKPRGIITAASNSNAKKKVTIMVKVVQNKEPDKGIQNEEPDSDKDSQSPVINRSTRFKNKLVQIDLNKNAIPTDEVNRSLGQSRVANNVTKLHSFHWQTDLVTKSQSQFADEMNSNQQTGAKRLISRPESKESNASDGSIPSSQISNTMLDDSGDLYSTQIAGAGRNMKHNKRDVNQNMKSRIEIDEDNVEEILNLDSDEDDDLQVKEVTKTFSRKKPTIEPMSRLGGNQRNNRNEPSISRYFKRERNDTDHTRRSDEINLKPGTDGSQHVLSTSLNESNLKVENDMDLDPVSGVLVKSKDQDLNKQNAVLVQGFAMEDITNKHVHAPTNQISDMKQQRLNKRKQEMKSLEDIFNDEDDDESPIALHDFTKQKMTRAVATDAMMGGARPKTRRQKKPAETVTVIDADIEVGSEARTTMGMAGGSNAEVGRAKRQGRRGRGVEKAESDDEAGGATAAKGEPGVDCPLCGVNFKKTVIEEHAATCYGSAPQQEPAAGVGHQPMRQGHVRHHQQASDSEESNDGPVHVVVEANVKDVLKDIRTSPGEEGELVMCYICDAYCPKGARYDKHLEQCMLRARQQQLEVDTKGFQQAYRPPTPDDEPEIRLTRRRIRTVQATGRDSDSESPVRTTRAGNESPVRGARGGRESPVHVARARNESPVRGAKAGRVAGMAGGRGRVGTATATVTRRDRKEDGYKPGIPANNKSSPSESESRSSSWDGSTSSSSDGDDDDNITLGTLARAGSSSLVTGPWNSRQGQAGTQPDGSNTVPDWLRRTADSPIKSFVPVSMQENSDYFKNQFSYNEKRVMDRQKKRKRSVGKPKRRKRRKVRRKKKTN